MTETHRLIEQATGEDLKKTGDNAWMNEYGSTFRINFNYERQQWIIEVDRGTQGRFRYLADLPNE